MKKEHNTAVVGLGSMGYGMALSCVRAGHKTYGYDVSPEPMRRLQNEGGQGEKLFEIISTIDAVMVVVLNDDILSSY